MTRRVQGSRAMPTRLWKPTLLAAVLGMAACAGLGRAQDVETNHPYVIDPAKPHPVLHLLHVPLPLTCWASHNGYGCGSWRSQATFVFGSCRDFFGQPCLNGPPPPPWAPDADQPPSDCGCR